jgi:choline monooxygenase
VYAAERTTVWWSNWLAFAPAARFEAPGAYVAEEIAGWPIVVMRSPSGELAGFHNTCPHRGGPMVWNGHGVSGNLVCRYHGWAFGFDGALKSARDFGGDADCDGACALTPIGVEVWGQYVWVDLAAGGVPLMSALGSFVDQTETFPIEEFRFAHHQSRVIACNWKTYADNYLEGYHIPLLHPELNREIDVKGYRVDVFADDDYCLHTAPARDGSINSGRWLFRYPNLAYNVYEDGMNVEQILPLGADRTIVAYDFFFRDPDAPEIEETVKLSAVTLDQDQQICEAVQRSLDAGLYRSGPLSPKHEAGLGWFQDRLRSDVGR